MSQNTTENPEVEVDSQETAPAEDSTETIVAHEPSEASLGHGGDRHYRKARQGYVVSDKMDKTVVVEVEESAYPQPEQFYVMQNGEPQLVTGTNRTLFVASQTRARPWAYAFDGRLNNLAAFLRRHDIQVERLRAPVTANTERFRLTSIDYAEFPYQNHLNATPTVETVAGPMELPEGMYIVRMSQNAARLVSELMEPDTDDSVVVWNLLDHSMPNPRVLENPERPFFLPIYRIMAPAPLQATLID